MAEKAKKEILEGIKVADFSWIAAGPFTTTSLAAYGATVVRIESRHSLDGSRNSFPFKDGIPGVNRSGHFAFRNPNKYGIALDLNNPDGMNTAKRLISWSDIVVENFVPGRMEKWGLGYQELKKIKPDIIMARVSTNGQTGPWATRKGYGILTVSEGGYSTVTGWPDRLPTTHQFGFGDLVAPRFTMAAILAALIYKRKTGKGMCIDQAQIEGQVTFMASSVLDYTANGRDLMRKGDACDYAAPHMAFRCKGDDRWCVIAVFTDRQWESCCRVIGDPGWTRDARFSTLLSRKKNEDELNCLLGTWTINHQAEEVMRLMQEAGVPAGITQTNKEVLEDPQLNPRNHIWWLEHPEIGSVPHYASPIVLSKTPAQPRMPAPCLGQHTEYVCKEFLHMSNDEFHALMQKGAFE